MVRKILINRDAPNKDRGEWELILEPLSPLLQFRLKVLRYVNLEHYDLELTSKLESRGTMKLKARGEGFVDLLDDVGLGRLSRFLRNGELLTDEWMRGEGRRRVIQPTTAGRKGV
jgi:hypothetical protein